MPKKRPLSPSKELTPREREIAELVAEGYSNEAVSLRLGIALDTVKKHLWHTFPKLGVMSRLELAVAIIKSSGQNL